MALRFVVLERASPEAVRSAVAELRPAGEPVVSGWRPVRGQGRPGAVVCVGSVHSAEDAARAVLAAVAGARLVVDADAERDVVDQMCDDLRRLGELDHRVEPAPATGLTAEQRALLARLLGGATLGEAARALHISRRTADRRLAAARQVLGAETTAGALRRAAQLGIAGPRS